jgi:multiple sugar transport system permease protein
MATRATTAATALRHPIAARKSTLNREQTLWAYIFLLPWIVGLTVFIAGPILYSLGLSFFNYTLGREATFIGLDNWIKAFTQDELFWPTIGRTFLYTGVVVPLSVAGALMIAVLLNQRLRFTTFYRTVFFMPHLTPIVAATYIWLWLLNPQYGLLDEIIFQLGYHLTGTGWKGPGWFSDPGWALPALMAVALWAAVGGNMMVIFLAGLQGIPQELYEAASIDGASATRRFWHVTLPMISPTLFFNSVLACITAFQAFETSFIGTRGGPAYATWLYSLHIYRNSFEFFDMGYAATLAWILFVALSVFTFLQFRWSRNWVYYGSER